MLRNDCYVYRSVISQLLLHTLKMNHCSRVEGLIKFFEHACVHITFNNDLYNVLGVMRADLKVMIQFPLKL